jgi:hypothetical protein
MKVSEKSLELNVGAELLSVMRNAWGMRKAYLRGLTQREEKQEGVDFFVQLNPSSRIFAFQFKAPKGSIDLVPYRYTLVKEQHNALFALAKGFPGSVFYVLPFYVTTAKLQQDVPTLIRDTWLLQIDQMPTHQVFGTERTKVVRCQKNLAMVNPEYRLLPLNDMSPSTISGIPAPQFAEWYSHYREVGATSRRRQSPWLARGLRIAIVHSSTKQTAPS